jgi:hypothetical protein
MGVSPPPPPPPSPEDGRRSSFRNVVFSRFYNTGRWTKSKKPSNSECYTTSSEPFRLSLYRSFRDGTCRHTDRQTRYAFAFILLSLCKERMQILCSFISILLIFHCISLDYSTLNIIQSIWGSKIMKGSVPNYRPIWTVPHAGLKYLHGSVFPVAIIVKPNHV